ncbi:MAG: lipopolysaccharide biosynthesis protein [Myxococcota bacterium]
MTAINIKTLARSSLTGGAAQLWRILSRFILTPVIIGAIGLPGYGVWTLVFSVAAYVQMSNASLGLAYTKFTAECVRKGTYDELTHIIGSGIALVTPIGVIGLGVAWWWGEALLLALRVPAELAPDAAIALVVIIFTVLLRMTVGCTLEVLAGLQRIDLTYRLYVLASMVEFAVSLPLLLMGHGLLGLAVGVGVGQVVINIAAYSMVRRRLPQVHISPRYISRDGLRKIISVGGRFQMLSVVNTVVLQSIKLLLSWLMGVEWVGIYELADKLIRLGKTASEAVIAPLLPAFASLRAGGERLRERMLFLKGSKADAFMGGTSFAFLALFAPEALLVWTGESVPDAAWALRTMAFGDAVVLLTSIVSSSLRSQGKVGLEFTRAMINTGILVLMVIPLGPAYGFAGLIYSRLVSQTLSTFWYLWAYFRFAGMTWGEYLRGTRIPWLMGIIATLGGAIYSARQMLGAEDGAAEMSRYGALFDIVLWGTPFIGVLGFVAWRVFLTADDRSQMGVLFEAITNKLRGRATETVIDVVIVADGPAQDAALPVLEAAGALGHAETMGQGVAGQHLGGGASVHLVLAILPEDGDPERLFNWVANNRPDLADKIAFVGGPESHAIYEAENLRRYPMTVDAETLRNDWGEAPKAEAEADGEGEAEATD